MLLLAMVAAVTIADDPVLVTGTRTRTPTGRAQRLARLLSCRPWVCGTDARRTVADLGSSTLPKSASRRAALSLLMLSLSMMVFVSDSRPGLASRQPSWLACAGLTGSGRRPRHCLLSIVWCLTDPMVMALWVIAWAGQPLASLADGWIASSWGDVRDQAPAALLTAAVRCHARESGGSRHLSRRNDMHRGCAGLAFDGLGLRDHRSRRVVPRLGARRPRAHRPACRSDKGHARHQHKP